MHIITIFRIIISFQGWYKGTIEGLGSSICHNRSREQEQDTSIPDWLLWYNEGSIIQGDALLPNHDVHSMTSIEYFRRKRIAVNPLHTLVLGVPQHQTIEQSKMALVVGRLLHCQGFQESIHLWYNMCKTYNAYNTIGNLKYFQVFSN